MDDVLSHGARGPSARSRLERLISVDHPDRSSTFPAQPRRPAFLSYEPTSELPLVALDEGGKELSRFRRLADLAWYLSAHAPDQGAPTLPFSIARQARRAEAEQLELGSGAK